MTSRFEGRGLSGNRRVVIAGLLLALGMLANTAPAGAKTDIPVSHPVDWFTINGHGTYYVYSNHYAEYTVDGLKVKFPKDPFASRLRWRDFAKVDLFVSQTLKGVRRERAETFVWLQSDKDIARVEFHGWLQNGVSGDSTGGDRIHDECTREAHDNVRAGQAVHSRTPFCKMSDRGEDRHSMRIVVKVWFASHPAFYYNIGVNMPIAYKGALDTYRYARMSHDPARHLCGVPGRGSRQRHVYETLHLTPAECDGTCGPSIWFP